MVTSAPWWKGGRPQLGFLQANIGQVRDPAPPKGGKRGNAGHAGQQYDPEQDEYLRGERDVG
jgi:hypothetical protein